MVSGLHYPLKAAALLVAGGFAENNGRYLSYHWVRQGRSVSQRAPENPVIRMGYLFNMLGGLES